MKFLKFLLAVILLPALYSLGRLGHAIILRTAPPDLPWIEIGTFALGFSTCFFAYLCLPRGNWFYVLGHETTHAFAVLLSGGRVSGFKVGSKGGHVVSDRNSFLIALSPYFVPFYPLVCGLGWSLALFIKPELGRFDWAFLLVWGATWGFHACHTLSLLKTEQPDFESQGYFFSFVLISLMNLLILELLVWCWLRPLPASELFRMMGTFLSSDYLFVLQLVKSAGSGILHP